MTPFACTHCQAAVFFENTSCGQCGSRLGFDPPSARMQAYRADAAEGTAEWEPLPAAGAQAAAPDAATPARVPCQNRVLHDNCNWMVDDADQGATLCRSCRLTRTIPDLSVAGNAARWAGIEQAKRRLLYGLQHLGLTPQPRRPAATVTAPASTPPTVTPAAPAPSAPASAAPATADASATMPDEDMGLCFDLLATAPDGTPVQTGHDSGVITLDIAEADDAHREAMRVRLGEPLRTLLGHLRHEVSHYLQYRWILSDPGRSERCRAVFGDERQDYAQALARHYQQGAPADWPTRCISAYASAHPWEDWAETCAHWLLIVDATQTAAAWGLRPEGLAPGGTPQAQTIATDDTQALVLQRWLPVAQFLNAMNRSIGVRDSYPFLMPPPVLDKLATVASLLGEARAAAQA